MSKITYNLLPKQKPYKHNLNVEIDLYPYATELYGELERIGIIERLKEVPQLGVIKVSQKLAKTRYDYIMLQLYLHQLIRNNLQGQLSLTYNNYIKAKEFREQYQYGSNDDKPTIGDILQLLTITYNIGHFYDTFTASRAVMMMSKNESFVEMISSASNDERFISVTNMLIYEGNYQRIHLINSILILEQCDKSKKSVSLSLEILYSYMNEDSLCDNSKLRYVYNIFRSVRNISYIAYDLQVSNTPLMIDLCNEKSMLLLLKELLSEYNNNQSSYKLISSISKLLDDTVYNENSNAICYYSISRKMVSLLSKTQNFTDKDYYYDYFIPKDSIFNRTYVQSKDYSQSQILKLTFERKDRKISQALLVELEKTNNTRVGYYDRHSGEQTILVSLKTNCSPQSKTIAAYKAMKKSINSLRKINGIANSDPKFLLCAKFFLYYLFNENPVIIKPTISKDKCVLCTRGKNSRINEIQKLINNSIGNKDENHETQFMLNILKDDTCNDTSIVIPASVVVYQKEAIGKNLCEFDGMIIHPMRKKEQIVFMEAKNTYNKPIYGKNCLREKLDKLSLSYNADDIHVINYDAIWKYSI